MSTIAVHTEPAGPSRLITSTLAIIAVACSSLTLISRADAEPLGAELLSSSILLEEKPLEEIVVYGIRGSDEPTFGQRLMSDKLLLEVLEDAEMRQRLEDDFKKLVFAEIGGGDRKLRLGYDVKANLVDQAALQPSRLPLDLVAPAVVLNLSF